MEAQLFKALYQLIYSVSHPRQRRVKFSDRIVVLVYLRSVLHDRPVSWVCDSGNWRSIDRPFELPSDSAMSRRLRTVGVQQLLERVLAKASEVFGIPLAKELDSKPLYVGPYSKDRDAKRGRIAAGLFARGYRLHTLNHGRAVRQFTLAPMNTHDAQIAPVLLSKLEGGGGYALADNAYDSNDLHQVAAKVNHQLVAPARAVNKGVRDAKHNCQERLRSLDMLDSPLQACGIRHGFGSQLYNGRQRVESGFGALTFLGLHYLPAWVRGPRRVVLWTAGKILIHLCRLAKNKGLKCVGGKS
jgi:hypothetical protein